VECCVPILYGIMSQAALSVSDEACEEEYFKDGIEAE